MLLIFEIKWFTTVRRRINFLLFSSVFKIVLIKFLEVCYEFCCKRFCIFLNIIISKVLVLLFFGKAFSNVGIKFMDATALLKFRSAYNSRIQLSFVHNLPRYVTGWNEGILKRCIAPMVTISSPYFVTLSILRALRECPSPYQRMESSA